MGKLLNIVNQLHRRTARDYIGRMTDDKVHCMRVAKQYGHDYWDGDRRYGYGGYRYDGRWSVVAQGLIDHFQLGPDASILDIGCGRGFLLYEFMRLLPRCTVAGFDLSPEAIATAKEEVKPFLRTHRVEEPYPIANQQFDLAISLNAFHNVPVEGVVAGLKEMERVAKNKYLVVESFRDELELFNLQCWALTCESFFRPESWQWLFQQAGYRGDWEFIYFEGESVAASRAA